MSKKSARRALLGGIVIGLIVASAVGLAVPWVTASTVPGPTAVSPARVGVTFFANFIPSPSYSGLTVNSSRCSQAAPLTFDCNVTFEYGPFGSGCSPSPHINPAWVFYNQTTAFYFINSNPGFPGDLIGYGCGPYVYQTWWHVNSPAPAHYAPTVYVAMT
jgi:hypothetical protein